MPAASYQMASCIFPASETGMLLAETRAERSVSVRAQFAATACTIVSGAIAERARVEAYAIYSFFMAAWVYPVIVHSVWSSAGWASMFR
jgi:ammonia channel protein AmtB